MDGQSVSDSQSYSDLESGQHSQFLPFAANTMLIFNRKEGNDGFPLYNCNNLSS